MSALRKPAKKVKCPHCDWVGSARGLFSHSRLAHPTLPPPPTRGKRVSTTINPNQIFHTDEEILDTTRVLKESKILIDERERFLDILETWLVQQLPIKEQTEYNLKRILDPELEKKVKRMKSDDMLLTLCYLRYPAARKYFRAKGNKLI
jgi:hypothetical protein